MRFTPSRQIQAVSASLTFLDEKIRAELSGGFVQKETVNEESESGTRLPSQPRVYIKPEDKKGPHKG